MFLLISATQGHPGSNNDDIATATTIWVHFKAPPQRKQDADKKDAETYSARLDVEMNVPEKVMTLHSVNLRAVVGSANLHIPRKMHVSNKEVMELASCEDSQM